MFHDIFGPKVPKVCLVLRYDIILHRQFKTSLRNMDIKSELLDLVLEYVDAPAEDIDFDENLMFVEGVNSFVMISLIGSIEDHFGLTIPNSTLHQFKTLSDIVAYLEGELVGEEIQ